MSDIELERAAWRRQRDELRRGMATLQRRYNELRRACSIDADGQRALHLANAIGRVRGQRQQLAQMDKLRAERDDLRRRLDSVKDQTREVSDATALLSAATKIIAEDRGIHEVEAIEMVFARVGE